jgi:hypothetical protein
MMRKRGDLHGGPYEVRIGKNRYLYDSFWRAVWFWIRTRFR